MKNFLHSDMKTTDNVLYYYDLMLFNKCKVSNQMFRLSTFFEHLFDCEDMHNGELLLGSVFNKWLFLMEISCLAEYCIIAFSLQTCYFLWTLVTNV